MKNRKLALNKVTLRRLVTADLARARGAEWVASYTCDPECVPQPVLSANVSGEFECGCRVFSNDPRNC